MNDILNINDQIQFDERITKEEYRRILPYNTLTYNHNDEIRFQIQHQEHCILPSESFIYVEGHLSHTDKSSTDVKKAYLIQNAPAFLFDEVRYNLCGKEIDRTRNVGITSTIKILSTRNSDEAKALSNGGWNLTSKQIIPLLGDFSFYIRLDNILGFADDHKKIIPNAQHELILLRSKNDHNVGFRVSKEKDFAFKFTIDKIEWRVPYIFLNDSEKLTLYKTINAGNALPIAFRSWELHEYPLLPTTTKHHWTVKTSTQLEKPRYIFFAMQTLRNNIDAADSSKFDANNVQEFCVYLNDEKYPNFNFNLNFNADRFGVLYEQLLNFQKSFRGSSQPQISITEFKNSPFVVIDCSRQNEAIKSGSVDVRIEFQTSENIPDSTAAYCIIVHDRIIDYYPIENRIETHI